jgi:hypothetical protein
VTDVPEIQGSCDARFACVREAVAENFRAHGEVGTAVAVTLDGRPVVDLWAGWADAARTRPWRPETLVDVFSAGKAMAAVALLRLVERGGWRSMRPSHAGGRVRGARQGQRDGAHGALASRRRARVRRALPALAMYDWTLMTEALAAEKPWWPPGATHGYHVNTFGFLVGELVRRASGERLRISSAGPSRSRSPPTSTSASTRRRTAGSPSYLLPDRDDQLADHLIAGEARAGVAVDDARRALLHACTRTRRASPASAR